MKGSEFWKKVAQHLEETNTTSIVQAMYHVEKKGFHKFTISQYYSASQPQYIYNDYIIHRLESFSASYSNNNNYPVLICYTISQYLESIGE